VRVYGDDLKIVRSKADEVKRLLAKIDGVENPIVEYPEEASRLEIEPDLEKCKAHGVKPGEVRRAAAVLLSGIEVGNLFEEQKVFEVVVWGSPEIRENVTSVKELLIESPISGQVRLQDVANVHVVSGPTSISREKVARFMDVIGRVRGRDLAAIGKDVNQGLQQIEFPLEYRAELLGEAAERLATQRRVAGLGIAAAIGIFLLYQAAFGSWRIAGLMFLMLPLALSGGLIAVLYTGGAASFGSMLGFLAVLALATRQGMQLVHHYQMLAANQDAGNVDPELASFQPKYAQGSPFAEEQKFVGGINLDLVLRGTQDRFVPIVLSTVATALAFSPFVFFGNIPGYEIIHPMAIVVLGGLVTATLVNLYLLPALYLWLKAQPQAIDGQEPTAVNSALKGTHVGHFERV
jgi:Cu/Ag efflux pump CusA